MSRLAIYQDKSNQCQVAGIDAQNALDSTTPKGEA